MQLINIMTRAMGDRAMREDKMARKPESDALAYVHEANVQLRQLVHQFLTQRVTLTPDEVAQAQRELAALGLGTAWLHARLRDMSAGARED